MYAIIALLCSLQVISPLSPRYRHEEPFQAHEEPEKDAPEASRAVASMGEYAVVRHFGKLKQPWRGSTLEVTSSTGHRPTPLKEALMKRISMV